MMDREKEKNINYKEENEFMDKKEITEEKIVELAMRMLEDSPLSVSMTVELFRQHIQVETFEDFMRQNAEIREFFSSQAENYRAEMEKSGLSDLECQQLIYNAADCCAVYTNVFLKVIREVIKRLKKEGYFETRCFVTEFRKALLTDKPYSKSQQKFIDKVGELVCNEMFGTDLVFFETFHEGMYTSVMLMCSIPFEQRLCRIGNAVVDVMIQDDFWTDLKLLSNT